MTDIVDGIIQLPAEGAGKKVDTSELTVGTNLVERERDVVADPADPLGLARVRKTTPAAEDYGMAVRAVEGIPERAQRQISEAQIVAAMNGQAMAQQTRSRERVSLVDRRGSLSRGTR